MRIKCKNFLCRKKVVHLLSVKGITRNDLAFEFQKELRTINGWFQRKNQHPITEVDARKLAKMLDVDFADIVGTDGETSINETAFRYFDTEKKRQQQCRSLMKELLRASGYEMPYESQYPLSDINDDPSARYLDLLIQAVRDAHNQYLEVMNIERLNETYSRMRNGGVTFQKKP